MRHTALPVERLAMGEYQPPVARPITHEHHRVRPIGASSPSVAWGDYSLAPCWVVSMEEGSVGVSATRAGEKVVMTVLEATEGLVVMAKRGRSGGERKSFPLTPSFFLSSAKELTRCTVYIHTC